MKRLLSIAGILTGLMSSCGPAFAAEFPPVQNQGATTIGTMTVIAVTTTSQICLSTGSNVIDKRYGLFSFQVSSHATPIAGAYLRNRLYAEFFNDTSTEVWIGFNQFVTTTPGVNYGRRIPPGASWSNDGSIQEYWVKCATTTERKFVITQQK